MTRLPGLLWTACLLLAVSLPGCGGNGQLQGSHVEGGEHDEHDEHGDGDEGATVKLSAAAFRNARISLGAAGAAEIAEIVETPGEIHLNAERVLEVRPRYAGVLRDLRKRIGDDVEADEVVAVIQSNTSLTDYEVSASMSGTVIARPVVAGRAVDHEDVLLTIADLSTVWADFAIYPEYVGRIHTGLDVMFVAQNRPELTTRGRIRYVGPLLEQDTRLSQARVVLNNATGLWPPGLFVTATVVLDRTRVAIAVPDEAIVRTSEGAAVFRASGYRFEMVPVEVGRSDGAMTEIITGIAAGDSVVTANAFILKSELGKGEVEHAH